MRGKTRSGKDIEEERSYVKGLGPVRGGGGEGQISLKEKGTNHVCERANETLGMTILRRGVGTRKTRKNTHF